MKTLLPLLLLMAISCVDFIQVKSKVIPKVISVSVSGGRLILNGSNFLSVENLEPISSNLSGYTMTIQSKTADTLVAKLTHVSNSTLSLVAGTILSFSVSSADAQTIVNLTIEAAVPSGAVMAFDNAACPTGWTAYAQANGRMILGSGSGNLDKDGLALTSRGLNITGGRELASIALPASSTVGSVTIPGPNLIIGQTGDVGGSGSPKLYISSAFEDTTLGNGDNDNMPPFVTLKYCKKD
jgi:hypothetical protein